ncbi:MAG: sulfatase family protein [bacterium]
MATPEGLRLRSRCSRRSRRDVLHPQPSQLPAWAHNSHWVADRSIEFLQNRDRSRPFFLWSSFIHPHPPFSPPVPWNKLYRAPSMPLPKRPPDMRNLWVYINLVQNRYKFRDAGIDDNLLRVMKAYYYATVSFIDYNVGRILQFLEESCELDNTLIIWSSDHGEFLGDYDCFGKRTFLKATANVPLIVRYPERFKAGVRVESPASLIDIMPTFLAAAGIDTNGMDLDGVDLADLAANPSIRETVFGQYQCGAQANYMALTQRWKYIYSAPDNREFLFDLLVDPEETRNRAETLGYLERTRAMRETLISYLRQEKYTEPLDGDFWRIYPKPEFPRDPDAGLLFQDAPWARPYMHIPGYSDEPSEGRVDDVSLSLKRIFASEPPRDRVGGGDK